MGELTIRRNRENAVNRYQGTAKAEKAAAGAQSRPVSGQMEAAAPETLRRRTAEVDQTERQVRESLQTLQTGEAVLDEVQDCLERMARLAGRAAGETAEGRAALQEELDGLREGLDRIIRSAGALFSDEGTLAGGGLEELLRTLDGGSAAPEAVQGLPRWLLDGIALKRLTPEELLAALGLDKSASGEEILAAVTGGALERNPAAGCLAALYLGAVIAGGGSAGSAGLREALEGLGRLLERVADGASPDQAVEELTEGAFTGLDDFQARFTGGTAPDLEAFLTALLLSGGQEAQQGDSLLALLAGLEGMDLELMMDLFSLLSGGEAGPEAELRQGTAGPAAGGPAGEGAAPPAVLQLEQVRVTARDLSGISWEEGTLTVRGDGDAAVLGPEAGQGSGTPALRAIVIEGTGTVLLRNISVPVLTVEAGEARVAAEGETTVETLELKEGTALTLDGGGVVRLGAVRAGASSLLRLEGGAVTLLDGEGELGELPLPAVVSGPVSLAARGTAVSGARGETLRPADLLWQTLLPGWHSVTALAADGREGRVRLLNGNPPDPIRLWLDRGAMTHGYALHTVMLRGRDAFGRPRTRYAYLHWNRHTETFQEVSMYPNPFTVTGGEAGRDWVYQEESHTLLILSAQVTAVSGGPGTDASRKPFSGRIALADRLGAIELSLGGVECRVSSGGAFRLGRENDVTLLLPAGTSSRFESGAGYAGISLGSGTTLTIGRGARGAAGELTASGGEGGAGIGRDSGAGRDQSSRIVIRGGVITAAGSGGGAGIGAGRRGFMGAIAILGGTVSASGGERGGAGIGGALGAPAGDISIRGGSVTAVAAQYAAAIGAGLRGACGDVVIDGSARIVKAQGGSPGVEIGACLFGSCGKVQISGSADPDGNRQGVRPPASLPLGGSAVTLPRLPLSARTLGLGGLKVSTPEEAGTAQSVLDTDRRWVGRLQMSCRALYGRMERSGLYSIRRYLRETEDLVRDTAQAGALLEDMRQSILASSREARTHGRRDAENVRQLLE